MTQERSTDYGCVLPVVPAAGFLLADCVAGADRVSVCVADAVAIPDCRNRGTRGSGVLAGVVLAAGEDLARAARDLKDAETKHGHFRVISVFSANVKGI